MEVGVLGLEAGMTDPPWGLPTWSPAVGLALVLGVSWQGTVVQRETAEPSS